MEGYNLLDSWPWYELESCLESKCQEFGITFTKIQFAEADFIDRLEQIVPQTS